MAASTAVALSAVALATAEEAAHTARCTRVETQFKATTATIEQKHDYADCIQFLYPLPRDPAGAKAIVGVVLVVFIIGCIYGAFKERNTMDAVMFGFIALCILFFVALIAAAVGFLFS